MTRIASDLAVKSYLSRVAFLRFDCINSNCLVYSQLTGKVLLKINLNTYVTLECSRVENSATATVKEYVKVICKKFLSQIFHEVMTDLWQEREQMRKQDNEYSRYKPSYLCAYMHSI